MVKEDKRMSEWERERRKRKSLRRRVKVFCWKISFVYCPSAWAVFFFNFSLFSALTFYEFIFPHSSFRALYVWYYFIMDVCLYIFRSLYIYTHILRWSESLRNVECEYEACGWRWKWNEIPPSSPVMKNKKKSIARRERFSNIFIISYFSTHSFTHSLDIFTYQSGEGGILWWFVYILCLALFQCHEHCQNRNGKKNSLLKVKLWCVFLPFLSKFQFLLLLIETTHTRLWHKSLYFDVT